jgi:hypothetical protein
MQDGPAPGDPAVSRHRHTLVTVVFESEVELLRLQARSVRAYVTPDVVSGLVVIDNTARGLRRSRWAALLGEYGEHAGRVRRLRPGDIADRVPGVHGWTTQQVLKLQVATQVTTPRYLVLDAKDHFVNPLEPAFLEAPDGRPRVSAHPFTRHPLRASLERALGYVGLDPADHVNRFTLTVTPFVFDTGRVLEMIADIEASSGRPFAVEFTDKGLTDFFTYSAWLLAQGRSLDDYFDLSRPPCPKVWPGRATFAAVQEAVRSVDDEHQPVLSVHRRALARLDRRSIDVLSALWVDRGLLANECEARAFVRAFRASYLSGEARRKVRERWHSAAARMARTSEAP